MFRTYIKGECKMFDKYKDGNKLTNKEMFIMAFESVLEISTTIMNFILKKKVIL